MVLGPRAAIRRSTQSPSYSPLYCDFLLNLRLTLPCSETGTLDKLRSSQKSPYHTEYTPQYPCLRKITLL